MYLLISRCSIANLIIVAFNAILIQFILRWHTQILQYIPVLKPNQMPSKAPRSTTKVSTDGKIFSTNDCFRIPLIILPLLAMIASPSIKRQSIRNSYCWSLNSSSIQSLTLFLRSIIVTGTLQLPSIGRIWLWDVGAVKSGTVKGWWKIGSQGSGWQLGGYRLSMGVK